MGRRIGVTGASISTMEKGDRAVTDRTVKDLCREFRVRQEWLESGELPMFVEDDESLSELTAGVIFDGSDEEKALLKIIVTLSPEERALLYKLAEKIVSAFPA